MECDDCSAWDSAHFYKVETEERQGQAAGGHATCQVIPLRVVASLLSRRTSRRSVLTRLVARELWSRILLDVRWPSGRLINEVPGIFELDVRTCHDRMEGEDRSTGRHDRGRNVR